MMETLTRLWRRAPQPAVLQLARSRDSDWAGSALPQARRRLCREIRRKVPGSRRRPGQDRPAHRGIYRAER